MAEDNDAPPITTWAKWYANSYFHRHSYYGDKYLKPVAGVLIVLAGFFIGHILMLSGFSRMRGLSSAVKN